jgi:hypothetical protein
LSGKEQSLTVPRVLLWPTSFVHTKKEQHITVHLRFELGGKLFILIELYQTADHPALSPKICLLQWRVSPSSFLGGFCSTTWKTRLENPPIDWEVGEGGRYAWGLAWLIFTTAIVF